MHTQDVKQISLKDEALTKASLMVLGSFASEGQPMSQRTGEEAITIAREIVPNG